MHNRFKRCLFKLGILVFASVVLAVIVVVSIRAFLPPNHVQVFAPNLPPESFHVSFIVESNDGIHNMEWLVPAPVPWIVTARGRMHPARCIVSNPGERQEIDGPFVDWHSGTRYGLLVMTRTNEWTVYWFTREEIEIEGNSILFGRGSATFRIQGRVAAPFPQAELRNLGLQDVNAKK